MNVVSVIFINSDGKLLVQHHKKLDMLTPVSGKMEPGESPDLAIVREIQEETAMSPHEYKLKGFTKINQLVTGDIEYMYHGELLDGVPINAEEEKHHWLEWKSREEIMALSPTIPLSESIRSALELFPSIR